MYDVNGLPPIETSTRRAASFGVTVTSVATAAKRTPSTDVTRTAASGATTIGSALFPRLFMRARGERGRNLEPLSILTCQQAVGFLVVDELLRLAVEGQLAADLIRNVPEVRQRR